MHKAEASLNVLAFCWSSSIAGETMRSREGMLHPISEQRYTPGNALNVWIYEYLHFILSNVFFLQNNFYGGFAFVDKGKP